MFGITYIKSVQSIYIFDTGLLTDTKGLSPLLKSMLSPGGHSSVTSLKPALIRGQMRI